MGLLLAAFVTLVSHQGAADPAAEQWTRIGPYPAPGVTVGAATDSPEPAWSVTDDSTLNPSGAFYTAYLTPSQLDAAQQNGWRFRVRARSPRAGTCLCA